MTGGGSAFRTATVQVSRGGQGRAGGMTEREAYIALNMMENVGPVTVRSMAGVLGSVPAILEAEEEALIGAPGIGRGIAQSILDQRGRTDVATELERAESAGAHVITPADAEYPAPLKEIHDPPLALYVRGALENRDRHSIAVVGTRRPTHYGRRSAELLAGQLARAGMTVTSGLALGIDTAAHQGALRAQGRTVAVLGGALDCLYPPSNAGLAGDIAERGAVLSEFPFGRRPDKTTFPMRNRIVSGLSLGVLVVEADRRSGAMITAREALEQGRSVLAVPGRIDSPSSRGCHALIRDGARLVSSVDDVLAEFEFLFTGCPGTEAEKPRVTADLSDEERAILDCLEEGEQQVDGLIRDSGLAPGRVSALLIGLEMKKMVRMLPGRSVEKIRT